MPNSTQSSPAQPGSARRQKSRRSRSVGSPAMSNASARLSAIVQEYREKNLGSFALSPLVRRSLLTDNTDIGEPTRKSWWKNLDENSRDVIEVLESNKIVEPNNIMEELDLEILSQEKKTYTLDIPDSSDGESIHSIVLPQRKLFTDKTHQTQNKFGKLIDNRDTLDRLHKANATTTDKAMNVGPKELFQNKRSKPIFPAALLNISPNKTMADKTLTAVEPQPQVRNIFGNRQGTKRKNMFANFILSESEDEISEIQAKVFEFHKESSAKTPNIRDHSPTSSVTTDMELDEWQHLPSSTMVENQLEAMIPSGQTPKRARLSILSEAKESECGGTINKTKQSNKSSSVKNLSKIIVNEKSPESNKSLTIRNRSRAENEQVNKSTEKQNKSITKSSTKNISKSFTLTKNKSLSNNSDNMEKNISQTQKNNKQANMSVNKSTTQDHNRDFTDKGQEVNPENVKDDTDDELNFTLEYENEDNDGVGVKCDQRQMNIIDKSINNINKSEQNIGKSTNNNKSNENVEESNDFKLSMKNNERNDKHKENESKISSGDVETTTVNNLKTQEVNEIDGNKTADINRNDVSANNTSTGNNHNIFQSTGKECEDNENQNEELNNKDDNSMIHENENNEAEQVEKNLSVQSQLDENQELNKTEEIEDDKQNGSQQTHNESGVENSENRNESEGNNTENEIKDANQSEDIQNESQEEVQNATEVEEDDNESDNEMEEGNQSQCIQNESHEAQNVTNEEENLEESENEIEAPNETQEIQNESENEEKYISEEEIENDEVENELEESDQGDQEAENDEEVESKQEQNSDQSNNQIESDQDNDQQEESDQDNDQQEESDQEIESNHSVQDNQEENQDTDEINATPNVSHDTTGRNRKKNQSPEMVLHDTTNNQMADMATFIQRRNTNARTTKSMIKNLHTPILAPARDSVGFSDGSKNSSAEGSGWDSHRTTRKTLRQTFGKDFTPRKSLRTLVMEKSAKRQTYHPNQSDSSVTSKFPLANSTTLPEVIEYDDCANAVESDHEPSIRTRQTNLEMYLQKVKKQNMEKQLKVEETVKQYLKAPPRNMDCLFKVPTKPIPRRPIAKSSKTKPKQTKSLGCLQYLPEDVIEDMKYKPPKRFQPSDAPWITKRLYKYLETKLEAKYHYKARVRSEKLVESIYHFTKDLRRQETASIDAVEVLKCEMARLDIVRTHHEFYLFFHQFMPREVRIKVVPDVINKIPLPRHGVFADILRGNTTIHG